MTGPDGTQPTDGTQTGSVAFTPYACMVDVVARGERLHSSTGHHGGSGIAGGAPGEETGSTASEAEHLDQFGDACPPGLSFS